MLMALGSFTFQLSALAYHELRRSIEWRHPCNSRVGARPATQFVGVGEDTIEFSGTLVPELAGQLSSLAILRAMGDAGSAYAMVDGLGNVMGAWVILGMQETGSYFAENGVARKTDFSVRLLHVDDEKVDSAPPGSPAVATNDNGSGATNLV